MVYDTQLTRMAKSSRSAGFMRTIQQSAEIAKATGDMSPFDGFALDRASKGMAQDNAVPEDWMATSREIAQKQKARAQAAQQDAQIKALPGQAAMLNAKTKMAKAQEGAQQMMPQQGAPMQPQEQEQQPNGL